MLRVTTLVFAATLLAIPARAAEVWNCTWTYEANTADHFPRVTGRVTYLIDGDHLGYSDHTSPYSVVAKTDFGLLATQSQSRKFQDGAEMMTEVISINWATGAYRVTQVHAAADRSWVINHEGTCQRA